MTLDLLTGDAFTVLYHMANLAAFLAFMLRDHIHLRLLMGVSLLLQALYYFAVPGGPNYDPLFWKVISFFANLVMLFLIFESGLDYGIPQNARDLYKKLRVLSLGQFRRLLASSTTVSGDGSAILQNGVPGDRLFYLVEGTAVVSKNGTSATIPAGTFLGEVSFLNGGPASATVTLSSSATCIAWDSTVLRQLLANDPAIDIAIRGYLNHDLAGKVAGSMPIGATPPSQVNTGKRETSARSELADATPTH